jgi:hypothetical protein
MSALIRALSRIEQHSHRKRGEGVFLEGSTPISLA